jgi:hypothetical protein
MIFLRFSFFFFSFVTVLGLISQSRELYSFEKTTNPLSVSPQESLYAPDFDFTIFPTLITTPFPAKDILQLNFARQDGSLLTFRAQTKLHLFAQKSCSLLMKDALFTIKNPSYQDLVFKSVHFSYHKKGRGRPYSTLHNVDCFIVSNNQKNPLLFISL